jgi:hypothetical protein
MTKVTLSTSATHELLRRFRATTQELPQRAHMIPSLRWATKTSWWTNARAGRPTDPALLGPPTHVTGPSFWVGAIERDKVPPDSIVVADGKEYEVVLSPSDQERAEVRIDFGFFVECEG